MRKKIRFIILFAMIFLGFAALTGGLLAGLLFKTDTGIYIAAESPFILFDRGSGEPVIMLGQRDNMFSGLDTGDRILIIHNGAMMLSLPPQINVLFCIRLKKGDASCVPAEAMNLLKETGWLQGGALEQDQ